MSSVALISSVVCGGGSHATSNMEINGGVAQQISHNIDQSIVSPKFDEISQAVNILLQIHMQGMTRAQARTAMENGITIAIGRTSIVNTILGLL